MLSDLLKNDYFAGKGYNCAEQILYGANEAYDLNLSQEALNLSAGFGGGMAVKSTCGALTASVMVLSSLMKNQAKDPDTIRATVGDFLNTYERKMSSINCKELLEAHFSQEKKCKDIIVEAAELLDQFYENIK